MADSTRAGPLSAHGAWTWSRTPGTLGHNDQGDPGRCTRLGDTPGTLGLQDWGDPTLPFLSFWGQDSANTEGMLVRTDSGVPLSLPASGVVPGAQTAKTTITEAQLKTIFPAATDDYIKQVADELNTDLVTYGLDSVLRRAHFFAQVRQEGGPGLKAQVESLQYSPEGLKATFKYYRLNPEEAVTDGYERDPKTRLITRKADQETIANKVYANRNGNGASASGDGWSYRGRGLIQVTGRSNYAQATSQYALLYSDGVDFVGNPDLMATFPSTVRSAVCFWIQHELHKLADRGSEDGDVDRITAVINRNTDSYGERQDNFTVAYEAFDQARAAGG